MEGHGQKATLSRIGSQALVVSIAFIVLAVPVIASPSLPAATAQNGETQYSTYENQNAGIKIRYPSSWERDPGDGGVVMYFFSPLASEKDVFRDFAFVFVEDLPSDVTLDRYLELNLETIKAEWEGAVFGDTEQVLMSDLPGYKVVFTSPYMDLETKVLFAFTIHEGKAYMFWFTAEQESFAGYMPQIQEMLDSFTVLASSGPANSTSKFTYEHASAALKLTYPGTWSVVESGPENTDGGINLTFDIPGDAAVVFLTSHNVVGQVLTLERATEFHMTEIEKGVSLLRIHERGTTTLGGHPAEMVSYSGLRTYLTDQLITLQVLEVWTVVDNREYSFIYASLPEAHEQYLPQARGMIESIKIHQEKLQPLVVTGTHKISDIGFSIEFPENWTGYNILEESDSAALKSSIVVIPNDDSRDLEQMSSAFTIVFTESIESWLEGPETGEGEESEESCSFSGATVITEINRKKAYEFTGNCLFDSNDYNAKGYMFVTSKAIVSIVFCGLDDYETELAEFEASLDSIKLDEALDLSDYEHLASVLGEDYGQVLTKQTLIVEETPYDLEIFSNSRIHSFKLDQDMKRISFLVEGQEGRFGITQVEVGKVLEGPYIVTIDGTVVQDPVIIEDRTSGRVFVSLGHFFSFLDESSSDSYVSVAYDRNVQASSRLQAVTITGANVVPEFPTVIIIIMMGLGAAVLIGRLRPQFSGVT
jgi:hypothetical protein